MTQNGINVQVENEKYELLRYPRYEFITDRLWFNYIIRRCFGWVLIWNKNIHNISV